MGSIYQRGQTYWIKYYRNGKLKIYPALAVAVVLARPQLVAIDPMSCNAV